MNRRDFLQRVSLASASVAVAGSTGCVTSEPRQQAFSLPSFPLEEATISQLQAALASGKYSSAELTRLYLARIEAIDRNGPKLKAVLALNPEASNIAAQLDEERRTKGSRGPLHGIPVLIKDNISTHDQMATTAGSLALAGSIAPRDAFIVERLRAAGAVILGKTNLSEWANFRGNRSISGWSAVGGQTRNPYFLTHGPSGSSSGSAAATSANLCAVSVGTETNGSIVSPSSYCGIVGLKPTVGLVSRSGIIPIAASMDTAGPMTRTVADAATLLGTLAGPDERDPATQVSAARFHTDYTPFLTRKDLRGVRLGMVRGMFTLHPLVDPVFAQTVDHLRSLSTEVVENVSLPAINGLGASRYLVMLYEFKAGLNAYLAALGSHAPVKSLDELIAFNERERKRELAFFGQETLREAAAMGPLTDSAYLDAKRMLAQYAQELSAAMDALKLDALIAPTAGPAGALDYIHGDRGLGGSSTPAATAGFPHITVPCGNVFGLPVGFSFFSRAWSEPELLSIAHAFEQSTSARISPKFLANMELA